MSTEPSNPNPEPNEPTPTAEPSPAPAEAHASAEGEAHEGEHEEGEGEAPEGAEAGATATTAEGAPRKKRRRRRKKKPGAEGAQTAEGAPPAEGETKVEGAPKEGGPRRERKPRPEHHREHREHREPRERPAFNVGDVVFGKILELLDDAMILDLSGKGRAIFDRHELTLPEEPAQGPGADADDDEDDRPLDDLVAEAKAKLGQGGTPEAAEATAPGTDLAATVPDAPAEEAPTDTTATVVAAPADAPAAETTEAAPAAEPAEATPEKHEPEKAEKRHEEPPIVVTLPPVTEEVGASFVGVVHNDGGRGGLVVLTRHPRRVRHAKPLVALAFKEQTLIKGLVTGAIKGGIEVDIDGLRAFAPASHVDLRHGADLHKLIGKRLEFVVTQYGKRGRDVVLSRKTMLEAEAKATRATALAKLVPGTTVDGVVRSVVPFGAFIDVGGVEGLVPLSEMSHNRGDQPGDVFEAGQTVQVQVQRIDVKGKIWLSRRATLPDPWADVAKKYAEGTRHRGRVARLQPFGAFIELETGIDGLVHTSDLSMKRIEHPSEIVKVGDEIDVIVASVDPGSHKIALHPVPEGASPDEVFQKVALHKIVKVVVQSIESGGLQVRILGATGRGARGFITSAGTGTPRGTELRKIFPVGKEIDAKIIEIDPRRGEAKLSIKAMNEDTERNAYKSYRQQVKQEAKFGTFGDLLKKSQDQKS